MGENKNKKFSKFYLLRRLTFVYLFFSFLSIGLAQDKSSLLKKASVSFKKNPHLKQLLESDPEKSIEVGCVSSRKHPPYMQLKRFSFDGSKIADSALLVSLLDEKPSFKYHPVIEGNKSWDNEDGLIMTLHGKAVDQEAAGNGKLIKYTFENADREYNLKFKELFINEEGVPVLFDGKFLEQGALYLYVMHRSGRIYVGPKDGTIFHSSLSGDDWPIAAGEFKTGLENQIILLDESSGHFAPNKRVHYVVEELNSRNVKWHQLFKASVSTFKPIPNEKRTENSSFSPLSLKAREEGLERLLFDKAQLSLKLEDNI